MSGRESLQDGWATKAWGMDDGLKVSQLRNAMFLYRFASELEALSVLMKGKDG